MKGQTKEKGLDVLPQGYVLDTNQALPQVYAPVVGPTELPDSMTDNELVQEEGAFDNITGAISKFGQGASFGFAPKIYGKIQSALPYPYGSGVSYEQSVDDYMRRLQGYEKENPKTALLAELSGGLLTSGGAAGGVKTLFPRVVSKLTGKGMLHNIPKYSGIGAASGAVSGVGYAPPGEEKEGAISGAKWGLAIGGLGVPVLKLGGKIIELSAKTVKWISGTMASPKKKALNKLIQALKDDNVDPTDVPRILDALGDDAIIADVGGPNVLNLVDQMAMWSGPAQHLVKEFLFDRQKRQGARINDIVKKYLKQDQITIDDYRKLIDLRRAQASPFYREAYKTKNIVDKELDEVLKSLPDEAFVIAKKLAEAKQLLFPKIVQINQQGEKKVINYGMQELDLLKRGLGDVIEDAKRAGQKEIVAAYQGLMRKLLDRADNISPDYKVARKIYSSSHSAEEAARQGEKILLPSSKWDVTADFLKNASKIEKDYFKMGAIRAIRDKLAQVVDTGDKTKLFNKEAIRQRISSMFGSKAEVDDFLKEISDEGRKSQTLATIGGSQTKGRDIQTEQFIADPKSAVIKAVIGDTAGQGKANLELANMLLSPDSRGLLPDSNVMSDIFQRYNFPKGLLPATATTYGATIPPSSGLLYNE